MFYTRKKLGGVFVGVLIMILIMSNQFSVVSKTNTPVCFLNNPIVGNNAESSSGQQTVWWTVTFGEYPQAEVIADVASYKSIPKDILRRDDVIIDSQLYQTLVDEKNWSEKDTVHVYGKKYIRISSKDIQGKKTENANNYYADNQQEYHYFAYQPIKWRVLEVKEDRLLLMSDKILDDMPYNQEQLATNWGTSTIRSWLNAYKKTENVCKIDYRENAFLKEAFSIEEQEAILEIPEENSVMLPNVGIGENTTVDKLFLPSVNDVYAATYAAVYGFTTNFRTVDWARQCMGTTYAKARGLNWSNYVDYKQYSNWWLRTLGNSKFASAMVDTMGTVDQTSTLHISSNVGVRVSLYLNREESTLYQYSGTVCSNGVETDANGQTITTNIDWDESTGGVTDTTFTRYPLQSDEVTPTYSGVPIIQPSIVENTIEPSAENILPPTSISPSQVDSSYIVNTAKPEQSWLPDAQPKPSPSITPFNSTLPNTIPTPSNNATASSQSIAKGTVFYDKNSKNVFRITDEKTVELVKGKKKSISRYKIPATVQYEGYNYNVTSIASDAYKSYANLKSVTIGKNVKEIGENVFRKCTKLKKITIYSKKLNKVGKNCIKGTEKTLKIYTPKAKLKKYSQLFQKNCMALEAT